MVKPDDEVKIEYDDEMFNFEKKLRLAQFYAIKTSIIIMLLLIVIHLFINIIPKYINYDFEFQIFLISFIFYILMILFFMIQRKISSLKKTGGELKDEDGIKIKWW